MRNRKTEKEMLRIIESSANRTTDVRTFCESHSVSTASFYYWRKRLEGKKVADKFVPVSVDLSVRKKSGLEHAGVELKFGEVQVTFSALPDPEYLRSLLGLDG
jgi:hypothetical protein